jgi:hypothetical protein
MGAHRKTVIAAATRNKVPSIFDVPFFPRDGGLLSDQAIQISSAAQLPMSIASLRAKSPLLACGPELPQL